MPGRHIVSSFVLNYCFATLSWFSLDMTAAGFAMRVLISASSDRLLSIVEPRYVKLSAASSVTLSMLIDGGETMPWPITFVILMLIVSPNSLQAWESLSISCCRSESPVQHHLFWLSTGQGLQTCQPQFTCLSNKK